MQNKTLKTTALVTTALLSLAGCKQKSHPICCEEKMCYIMDDPSITSEQKLECLTERIDAISEKTIHCVWSGKSPPHYEHQKLFFNADYLYLKATEEGLEFAIETITVDSANNIFQENIEDLDFRWNSGVRLGLGYTFGSHDHWDLHLNWTWYQTDADGSDSSVSDLTNPLVSTWGGEIFGSDFFNGQIQSAFAKWNLHFNTLDLDLGRHYFVSKTLSLHPFLGLRGASIYQKYDVEDQGLYFPGDAILPVPVPAIMEAKNNFLGIGVRTGLDLLFHFNSHFGIYGGISAALLYGTFDIDQEYQGNFVNDSGILFPITFKNDHHISRVCTNIDANLGLQFETAFDCDRKHFTLAVGYEIAEWFKQNNLTHSEINEITFGRPFVGQFEPFTLNRSENGDLGLQGIHVKIRLDF